VIHTNLDSLFNMTRPVINGMRERNFGEKLRWSSSRAMMAWGAIQLL
jgi:acetoacetyl-CoA reductase